MVPRLHVDSEIDWWICGVTGGAGVAGGFVGVTGGVGVGGGEGIHNMMGGGVGILKT